MMRFKRFELEKIILAIVAGGALAVTLATLPGLALALKPFLAKRKSDPRITSLRAAIKRLRERRLVELVMKNGRTYLAVTEKGARRLRELEFEDIQLVLPAHWDKQWSVILFDIPERQKSARDALRQKLRALGCLQFHKSVFVHPAFCEDEVDFVSQLFGVQKYVTVFRSSSLGHQEHRAYKYFALKEIRETE